MFAVKIIQNLLVQNEELLFLKQVVHLVTSGFKGVKWC